MTDHLTAIKATIPPGDPSSNERMEWCKAAAIAIADVCLEHVTKIHGAGADRHDLLFDARLGVQSAAGEGDRHLRDKAKS